MLCWSFIFGGSFWVQQISPEKTLESPPRGLSPRWNRTWSIGRLWDAPLCNLLFQGRWARNLYLLLTLACKKHHQSPRWDCFPHHEKMGALFHAGKTKPQLLCGTAASEYSGPWPCPPTRGHHHYCHIPSGSHPAFVWMLPITGSSLPTCTKSSGKLSIELGEVRAWLLQGTVSNPGLSSEITQRKPNPSPHC